MVLTINYPMTFFAGNDTFYRKLYDLTLRRFEPTIHTRWNIISELILSHYFFFISLIGATFFLSFRSFLLLAISNNFVFILKRWNLRDKKLKDQLIKDLEHEFGSNIFYHKKLLQKASKHLKVVRDSYRKSLVLNLKFENPPFIVVRDWNEFILDAKEKGDGRREITPTNARRYAIVLSTSTLMQ